MPRFQFHQPMQSCWPVHQPSSYSIPSPHRSFKNSSAAYSFVCQVLIPQESYYQPLNSIHEYGIRGQHCTEFSVVEMGCRTPSWLVQAKPKSLPSTIDFLGTRRICQGYNRNSVPKKIRGISSERCSLFRGKNAHFADFRVSRNSPLRGSERKGKVLREKMKFDGTANITTKETFHRQKLHSSANAIASIEQKIMFL